MTIHLIAEAARASLGPFCQNECKAYCCRRGYLPLTAEQVPVVTQGQAEELTKLGRLHKRIDGNFTLVLGSGELSCPSLHNYRCSIYGNKQRPQPCHDFPVFIHAGTVYISTRCLGVRENKLYPFIKQWHASGIPVVEGGSLYATEIFNVNFPDAPPKT